MQQGTSACLMSLCLPSLDFLTIILCDLLIAHIETINLRKMVDVDEDAAEWYKKTIVKTCDFAFISHCT